MTFIIAKGMVNVNILYLSRLKLYPTADTNIVCLVSAFPKCMIRFASFVRRKAPLFSPLATYLGNKSPRTQPQSTDVSSDDENNEYICMHKYSIYLTRSEGSTLNVARESGENKLSSV